MGVLVPAAVSSHPSLLSGSINTLSSSGDCSTAHNKIDSLLIFSLLSFNCSSSWYHLKWTLALGNQCVNALSPSFHYIYFHLVSLHHVSFSWTSYNAFIHICLCSAMAEEWESKWISWKSWPQVLCGCKWEVFSARKWVYLLLSSPEWKKRPKSLRMKLNFCACLWDERKTD